MRFRTLGKTGLEISEVGYGAWGIGGKQWQGGSDDESLAALRRSLELGLNFIDTALAYGDGHSEVLVGQIVRDAPGKVWVASKVPPKNRKWPARAGTGIDEVFPYDYIVTSTEESLRNLKMETLDLQQLHVWNPEWLEREEWRRAAEDLKKSGKIRHFGLSLNNHEPDSALEVIKTGLIDAVQVIYNVFDQTPEGSLFPLCLERGVGVLARVPLDEGALTGTITEQSTFAEGDFRGWYFRNKERLKEVVEHVEPLTKDLAGVEGTLPEIALRFCLTASAVSTVIPGMRRVSTVESSCGVSGKGPLPAAVMATLRKHAWNKNYYD